MSRRMKAFEAALVAALAFALTGCKPSSESACSRRLRIDIAPCANPLVVAREKVRSALDRGLASSGVEVVFAPGEYDVTETAVFGRDDSGSPQAKVVYRAARPDSVSFSGGRPLEASAFGSVTDERILARISPKAQKRVKVADVSKLLPPLKPWPDRVGTPPGPWLYADGKPLGLARWPNKTNERGNWARFTTPCKTGVPDGHRKGNYSPKMTPGSFYCPDARVDRWDVASGIWLFGYWTHDWAYDMLRVASVTTTPTNRIVALAAPHGYGIGAGTWGAKERRYYAVNLLEELDASGEWWLDRAARRLYLIPPSGFPEVDLRLAVLDKPFAVLKDVHDVEFHDLGFAYSHCAETAFELRGDCENVVLDGCDIRCLGGSGVQLSGRRNVFRNGSVLQVGGAGVRIRGGDRATLARADNLVADSEIAFYGRFVRTYAAGVDFQGVGQTVRGCFIHDAPHNAILYGGNDNLIQSNEICRVLLETGDAGAIYTGRDTSTLGNVIEGNYLHDLGGDKELMHCTMGIYFDDCDWGDAVVGNRFERLGTAVFIGGGNLHPVVGNRMTDCAVGVHMDARGMTWQKTRGGFLPNAQGESWQYGKLKPFDPFKGAWRTRYPELKALLADRPELPRQNPVSNNVFVACQHVFSLDELSQSVTNECPFSDNHVCANKKEKPSIPTGKQGVKR